MGSSPLVMLVSYLAPLVLVVAAAAWAWPLVSKNVSARASAPRRRWDDYFNGDRTTSAPQPSAPDGAAAQEAAPASARSADLPQGVSESIYDE